jgi:large conductance mechanosensitive channel
MVAPMRKLGIEFRTFLFRGNVIDLAVAVVLGTAFGAVVKALVDDILTPIIAMIFGQPDFATLTFTINSSHFLYGDFINAIIAFVSVAAAIFFFVVKPVSAMAERRAQGQVEPDSDTRPCTECLSEIPKAARRCAFCTAEQTPIDDGALPGSAPV